MGRIRSLDHETSGKKYKGKIELQMSYEEMKEKFGEDATIS